MTRVVVFFFFGPRLIQVPLRVTRKAAPLRISLLNSVNSLDRAAWNSISSNSNRSPRLILWRNSAQGVPHSMVGGLMSTVLIVSVVIDDLVEVSDVEVSI